MYPPLAEFRHVLPFFDLLQRLFGLRRHVRFTGSHLEFHDDAGFGYILGDDCQVETAIPAFPVRFDGIVLAQEQRRHAQHETVVKTFLVSRVINDDKLQDKLLQFLRKNIRLAMQQMAHHDI